MKVWVFCQIFAVSGPYFLEFGRCQSLFRSPDPAISFWKYHFYFVDYDAQSLKYFKKKKLATRVCYLPNKLHSMAQTVVFSAHLLLVYLASKTCSILKKSHILYKFDFMPSPRLKQHKKCTKKPFMLQRESMESLFQQNN